MEWKIRFDELNSVKGHLNESALKINFHSKIMARDSQQELTYRFVYPEVSYVIIKQNHNGYCTGGQRFFVTVFICSIDFKFVFLIRCNDISR